MIGLDTNVLARFLTNDDPIQSPQAGRIIRSLTESNPGWIGLPTILELAWTLRRPMRMSPKNIAGILSNLLNLDTIVVERRELVAEALELYVAGKADFGDCMIAVDARAAGCARTVTFDRVAARDAGMELIG